jgi:hypothetical protein
MRAPVAKERRQQTGGGCALQFETTSAFLFA